MGNNYIDESRTELFSFILHWRCFSCRHKKCFYFYLSLYGNQMNNEFLPLAANSLLAALEGAPFAMKS